MPGNFTAAEWAIVALYVVAVSAIGSLFYRKRSSSTDYFLGGREMRSLPLAISLVAADLSAITTMGKPGWGYDHNLELYLGTIAYFAAAPVVIYLFWLSTPGSILAQDINTLSAGSISRSACWEAPFFC